MNRQGLQDKLGANYKIYAHELVWHVHALYTMRASKAVRYKIHLELAPNKKKETHQLEHNGHRPCHPPSKDVYLPRQSVDPDRHSRRIPVD